MRIQTGIFGELPKPGEEPLRDVESLPQPPYSAVTDDRGEAVLKNVPAFLTMLDITHPEFQVPLGDRHGRTVRFKLAPGQQHAVDIVLEPKGKDFIGDITHSPR